MICLVCLDTTALAHVRYAVRRMRRKAPQAQIVLCCFGREMTDAELEQLLDGAKVDRTAPSLVEALAACLRPSAQAPRMACWRSLLPASSTQHDGSDYFAPCFSRIRSASMRQSALRAKSSVPRAPNSPSSARSAIQA